MALIGEKVKNEILDQVGNHHQRAGLARAEGRADLGGLMISQNVIDTHCTAHVR